MSPCCIRFSKCSRYAAVRFVLYFHTEEPEYGYSGGVSRVAQRFVFLTVGTGETFLTVFGAVC